MKGLVEKAVATYILIVIGIALLPTFLGASSSLQDTFLNPGTGDPVIDTIAPLMAILIPGVVAFILIILSGIRGIWS